MMDREWTTNDELQFLKGLRRPNLLSRYLKLMPHRKQWGKIDPKAIEAYLKEKIMSIEKLVECGGGHE